MSVATGPVGRLVRRRWRIVSVLTAVLAIGCAWLAVSRPWDRMPNLRISGGSAEGRRHRLAMALAHDAKRHGLSIEVVPTSGSVDALKRVGSGTLDLALVQGGLDVGDDEQVREVAPLHIEPLHLLVKPDLAEAARTNLASLAGGRIDLGPAGGGTRVLARRVLDLIGIPFEDSALSAAELLAAKEREALPDAVFLVSSLPSKAAHHLIADLGYRLVSVPFYEALLIDLRAAELPEGQEEQAPLYAYDAIIPAFTYGDPPEPVRTIGTRLLLVARDKVSADVVGHLLDTVYSAPFVHVAYPPLDRKLLNDPPELPWHDGTLAYVDRKPLSSEEAVDMLNNQLGIIGAVLGASFFIYQFAKRYWRRTRERGFEHYILRVARIERLALDQELASTPDLGMLLRLRADLAALHDEGLERFVKGDLEGEELMNAFLNHVNATRDHLIRLILHERDNLEDQATLEGRPVSSVWEDAMGPQSSPANTSGGH
jgi:TRAP transporter TAXI family solute receptor